MTSSWKLIRSLLVLFAAALCPFAAANQRAAQGSSTGLAVAPNSSSAMTRYSGYLVRDISMSGAHRTDQADLLRDLPLKPGQPLEANRLRASIQQLFATGRFHTIAAEAVPQTNRSVDVVFVVDEKLFVGSIVVYGAPRPPTANQLVNASKLQLGQEFDEDDIASGIERIKRVLVENGYFEPTIRMDSFVDPPNQRIQVNFVIDRGKHAKVGQINVLGDSGYPPAKIRSIAKIHPGDPVSAARVSRGLNRLRKKYQKKNRLQAQVAITDRNYHTDTDRLDYTFQINRGPIVEVRVEGAHLRKGLIKKYVPVFEENAVDQDLLNEGQRNLRDYFQTKGYFDVAISSQVTLDKSGRRLVIFDVDRGKVHKLTDLVVRGNKYFSRETIRERMSVQPADILLRHGLFSSALLTRDLNTIKGLYQLNGFQNVQVSSTVIDDYEGTPGKLRVDINIEEGPQTLVNFVQLSGNNHYSSDVLTEQMSTSAGQPFSPSIVANDRDSLINYYFDHGFPDVRIEMTTSAAPGKPNRQDVSVKIVEGRQVFIDNILISGLHFTKPFIVSREFEIHKDDPESQSRILNTQRRLYDLTIFNQVDIAAANPDGQVNKKDLMVQLEEAKRYTFDYGLGFQAQTGNVSSDCKRIQLNPTSTLVCNPGGGTGFSPLATLGVTRSNFRGRDDTIVFRTNLGYLQQRALVSYEQPHWLNRDDLTLTFNAFYDSTRDVLTFSSQRLEGSVQALQQWRKGETFLYRFTYRRVKVDQSTLQISPDLIPLLSRPVRVGIPSFSYVRDHRDDPIDSHRGTFNAVDFGDESSIF